MVVVVVGLLFYAAYTVFYAGNFCWQYFLGAALVAFISWLDDLYTISALRRLAVHAAAAALVVSSFIDDERIFGQGGEISDVFAAVFVFLWIVWLTNAYNFMDGIDGLAGLQAVVAGFGWMAAGVVLQMPTIEFYGGILASASLGFLPRNWQPAKIFMGDVGSAFLGYTFAVLPLLAAKEGGTSFWQLFAAGAALVWLILFDTIFTFCRRALKGERVWEPHRTHIYQRLVEQSFTHAAVATIYGAAAALTAVFVTIGLMSDGYAPLTYAAAVVEAVILLLLLKVAVNRKESEP